MMVGVWPDVGWFLTVAVIVFGSCCLWLLLVFGWCLVVIYWCWL